MGTDLISSSLDSHWVLAMSARANLCEEASEAIHEQMFYTALHSITDIYFRELNKPIIPTLKGSRKIIRMNYNLVS